MFITLTTQGIIGAKIHLDWRHKFSFLLHTFTRRLATLPCLAFLFASPFCLFKTVVMLRCSIRGL